MFERRRLCHVQWDTYPGSSTGPFAAVIQLRARSAQRPLVHIIDDHPRPGTINRHDSTTLPDGCTFVCSRELSLLVPRLGCLCELFAPCRFCAFKREGFTSLETCSLPYSKYHFGMRERTPKTSSDHPSRLSLFPIMPLGNGFLNTTLLSECGPLLPINSTCHFLRFPRFRSMHLEPTRLWPCGSA